MCGYVCGCMGYGCVGGGCMGCVWVGVWGVRRRCVWVCVWGMDVWVGGVWGVGRKVCVGAHMHACACVWYRYVCVHAMLFRTCIEGNRSHDRASKQYVL